MLCVVWGWGGVRVLCCVVLCCVVLCCVVLCWVGLGWVGLCCVVLFWCGVSLKQSAETGGNSIVPALQTMY